ncbi:hypothetical protein T492DRAFT_844559 [Pavlovales sp. CCMP2436]|nr:hypothetical protein T492DRAFT_844559 [Pavlovales sp. CCMP2436]
MSTMLTGESREALERQLRFYFSDANLRRDKFMRAQLGAEGREWMEVAVFVRFNRVAALTTDATQISLALAGIAEVELDESRARVRRACAVAAVTDASSSAQARRTVYVENLLMGTEQAELESLLRESVGPLSYVALPRFDWPASRPSKGYAFVEFDDERDAIRATTARVLMRRKAPAAAAAAAGAGATLPSIAAAAVAAAAADAGAGAGAPAADDGVLLPPSPRLLRIMLKEDWLALRDKHSQQLSAQLEWVRTQHKLAAAAALLCSEQPLAKGEATGGARGGGSAQAGAGAGEAGTERKGWLLKVSNLPESATREALERRPGAKGKGKHAASVGKGGEALAGVEYVDFPVYGEKLVAYARFASPSLARACADALRGVLLCVNGPAVAELDLLPLAAEVLSVDEAAEYWRKVNLERAHKWQGVERKRAASGYEQALGAGGRGGAGRGGGAARGGGPGGGRGQARGSGPGGQARGGGRSGGRGHAHHPGTPGPGEQATAKRALVQAVEGGQAKHMRFD